MIIVQHTILVPEGATKVQVQPISIGHVVREAWAAYARGERVVAAVCRRDWEMELQELLPPTTEWIGVQEVEVRSRDEYVAVNSDIWLRLSVT